MIFLDFQSVQPVYDLSSTISRDEDALEGKLVEENIWPKILYCFPLALRSLSLSSFVRLLTTSSTTTTTPIISLRRMVFLGSSRSVVFVRCDVEDIFAGSDGLRWC